MQLAEQKKRFYAGVLPSRPNTWEVDEAFEELAELDGVTREALLSHVGAIWPVSHSLCFAYLTHGVKVLSAELISIELLGEWVRQILGIYEKNGLLGARQFMTDVDKSFLGPMRGEAGVKFEEVLTRMVHYIRGISGRSFRFDVALLPSTDTSTIFLPAGLDIFPRKENNFYLYKLIVSLQWSHVASRIYSEIVDAEKSVEILFTRYPDKQLATDLFSVLLFVKAFRHLESVLPGLIRQGREYCHQLIRKIVPITVESAKCVALQNLLMQGILREVSAEGAFQRQWKAGGKVAVDPWEKNIFQSLPECYTIFSQLRGSYALGPIVFLLGEFNFSRARETIRVRRNEDRGKFVGMLASFLEQHQVLQDEVDEGGNVPGHSRENLLLLTQEEGEKNLRGKDSIHLDNEEIELPEELAALIREIEDDLGTPLPEAYVQAAAGQAGRGINRTEVDTPGDGLGFLGPVGVHVYSEWDYRRAGYRTDWCTLTEKSLHSVRSGFVAATLLKYQPQLHKLRRQFEMLRTRYRYVRRRRHGDDIDLDALIEALGDTRAGLAPSDRLFVQLLRDERDIAAMFLVDMSNSTEGWVGVAVKEALVLLAEALEVVGDRYGIYGFSGMRRSRSELFHIKHLDEPYSAEVQGRIAAIGPKAYTRMGPPIRHLTKKLLEIQSNVRLLVVISDGKPEDYDDYKGQYAIEDTRKALLEARGSGVYPFCITIDKSAHDYLAHMFGKGNYIFVNEVFALPSKMAEMYRLLTS